MIKQCVVCGADFKARGSAKTCSPECIKEHKRKYIMKWRDDPENKERARQLSAQRRADPENKERARQLSAQWYADPENKERKCQYQAQYRADPEVKERERQQQAQYRADPEVKERQRQYHAQYRADPGVKGKRRVYNRNRRARNRSFPNTLSTEQWQRALNYFNGCCAVCGRQLGDLFGDQKGSPDHWIPLSYDGDDNPGTVATNIVPLCHGIDGCNNSKSDTMPDEWLAREFGNREGRQIGRRIEDFFEWVREQEG